jgi:hypothetical protein
MSDARADFRDVTRWAEKVELSFEEQARANEAQATVNAKTEAKLREHEAHFAAIDQAQKTMNNQIEIFREAINEQFRRLREGLVNGRP